jgi:hypothetical protein
MDNALQNFVRIYADTHPTDPRADYDHLGTMVTWHDRYTLGDDQPAESPTEWRDAHDGDIAAILPLYLYDHSGLTISCSAFTCPWDSGQVGFIYVTKEKARAEFGDDIMVPVGHRNSGGVNGMAPGFNVAQLEKYLRGEVEEYDHYLTGQVYSFVIEDSDGDIVDSCGGFLGPIESNGMLDYIPEELHEAARAADVE